MMGHIEKRHDHKRDENGKRYSIRDPKRFLYNYNRVFCYFHKMSVAKYNRFIL